MKYSVKRNGGLIVATDELDYAERVMENVYSRIGGHVQVIENGTGRVIVELEE